MDRTLTLKKSFSAIQISRFLYFIFGLPKTVREKAFPELKNEAINETSDTFPTHFSIPPKFGWNLNIVKYFFKKYF
jgi:hypothetical protein